MNTPIAILGIAGSLRQASYNRATLRAAAGLVPEGARLDIFDLAGIPPFNQDDEANLPARVHACSAESSSSTVTALVKLSTPKTANASVDPGSSPQ